MQNFLSRLWPKKKTCHCPAKDRIISRRHFVTLVSDLKQSLNLSLSYKTRFKHLKNYFPALGPVQLGPKVQTFLKSFWRGQNLLVLSLLGKSRLSHTCFAGESFWNSHFSPRCWEVDHLTHSSSDVSLHRWGGNMHKLQEDAKPKTSVVCLWHKLLFYQSHDRLPNSLR